MNETIYDREQFIIGDVLIEVWESQTGWKWRIVNVAGENENGYPHKGYPCEGQTEGLLKALSWLSTETLEQMGKEDGDMMIALYPGLEFHKTW